MENTNTRRVALVVGVSGMVGFNLTSALVTTEQWLVYGVSRRKASSIPSQVRHIPCDLLNEIDCMKNLSPMTDITHVFFTTWIQGKDEVENIKLNSTMLKNLLNGLSSCKKLEHFVLVTGTKHYMGPFSAFTELNGGRMIIPFKESHPRVPCPNFYYSLEDILFWAAEKFGFSWSVARPPVIVGFAPNSRTNMMTSIAVYASLCKHTSLPFIFPGCQEALDIIMDCVDAKLLAKHLIWQAESPNARNQAFNVSNGDVFVWRFLWKDIADYFGIKVAPYPGKPTDMQKLMAEHENEWAGLVQRFELRNYKMSELATWWLVNAIFALPISCVTSLTKCRELGFQEYADSTKSVTSLFDHLRDSKYIP